MRSRTKHPTAGQRYQKGMATLMLALVVLVILTVIVLASTNVTLFEQKTTTSEHRQRLADQVAKYSLGMGVEFLKAHIVHVGSQELSGWLATNTTRWLPCSGVAGFDDNTMANLADGSPHPCMAEPDALRRGQLYFYSFADAATSEDTLLPFDSLVPAAGRITAVGGASAFGAQSTVRALQCRLDTTLVNGAGALQPACALTPASGSLNRLAVTLVANARMPGEEAAAQAKETWASFSSVSVAATVPLIASGAVERS